MDNIALRYAIVIEGIEYQVYGTLSEDSYSNGNIISTFLAKTFNFTIEDEVELKNKEFEVFLLENNTRHKIGNFITVDIDINDTTKVSTVYSMDYELKAQIPYVSSLPYESGTVTLFDVWQECCDLAGIENGMTSFQNSDFIVSINNFIYNQPTVHTVMREVAKSSMDFIVIGSDNKVYLILTNDTTHIIEDYTELEDKRDTQPITRLVYNQSQITGQEGVAYDQALIDEYGDNKIEIVDNLFAYTTEKRQFFADSNYNKIKLFGYSSFVAKNSFMPEVKLGDKIKFKKQDGSLVDSIVFRKTTKVEYKGVDFSIEAPSLTSSAVEYSMPVDAIDVAKRAEITVNAQEGKITQIVEQQSEQSSQITTIEQDIETIEAKLENISDYTDSKTEFNSIHLTGTVGGIEEPHQYGYVLDFKVYGSVNWKYDYPQNDYPQNDYPINNIPQLVVSSTPKGDLSGDYMFVPLNLEEPLYAYVNGGLVIRDELYIQSIDGLIVSTLTKRIERLADGTLQLLTTPIVKDVGQILIPTYADNTYIYVRSINDVEYYARWLLENDYSGVFATKVEVTNRIEIAEEGILLEAQTAIDTATEPVNLVSQINLLPEGSIKMNASNTIDLNSLNINMTADNVTIDSDNFSVDSEGKVTATAGDIAGFVMNNISFSKDLNGIYEYTIYDLINCQSLLLEKSTIDSYYESIYDTNNTGDITVLDLDNIRLNLLGEYEINKNIEGKIKINSDNPKKCIAIEDSNGQEVATMGMGGVEATMGTFETMSLGDRNSTTLADPKIRLFGKLGKIICVSLEETSQAEKKKNFEKLENALDILKEVDIYKYNFKDEEDNSKKHIGFVIGDDFRYSKELTNEDNTGVNAYGLASVNTKAIQELYDIIKVQQEEIKELKAMIKKESD